MFRNHRRGISPIVASVILIGISLSMLLVIGPFFNNIIGSSQDDIEGDSENLKSEANANFELVRADVKTADEEVHLSLQNEGQTRLKQFIVRIWCDDGTVKDSKFNTTLEKSELSEETVKVNDISGCTVDKLEVVSDDVGGLKDSLKEGSPPEPLTEDELEVNS